MTVGPRITIANYRRPKFFQNPQLMYSDDFLALPDCVRLIYPILANQNDLSMRNHMVNQKGEAYFYFSRDDLAKVIGKTKKTVIKAIGILKGLGIVEEEPLGPGKGIRMYLRPVDENSVTYDGEPTYGAARKKSQSRKHRRFPAAPQAPAAVENAAPAVWQAERACAAYPEEAPYEAYLEEALYEACPSTPVTGSPSTPVTGDSSTPVTGDSSTPVTGDSSTPVTGDSSTPVTGQTNGLSTPVPVYLIPSLAPPESPGTPENPAPVASPVFANQTQVGETEVRREAAPSHVLKSSLVKSSQTEVKSSQTEPRTVKLNFKIADGYAAAPDPDGLDGQDPSKKLATLPPQNQNPQARPAAQPPIWLPRPEGRGESRAELWGAYREIIMDNINYSALRADRAVDIERVDEIVICMLDVIVSDKELVWISQGDKPREVVRGMYLKIREHHIRRILESFKAQDQKITKVGAYLKTMLYNEIHENAHAYTNDVQVGYADMAL